MDLKCDCHLTNSCQAVNSPVLTLSTIFSVKLLIACENALFGWWYQIISSEKSAKWCVYPVVVQVSPKLGENIVIIVVNLAIHEFLKWTCNKWPCNAGVWLWFPAVWLKKKKNQPNAFRLSANSYNHTLSVVSGEHELSKNMAVLLVVSY